MDVSLLRRPSAYLPIALSLVQLALIAGFVAIYGLQRGQAPHDEGGAARLYQLLLVLQAATALFFAAKWLPRSPRQAFAVLIIQAMAVAVPFVTVVLLER